MSPPRGTAQKLGINTAELLVSQPDHGEMAFNVLDELVRSGAVDVVVVDSVSALTPRSEVEGDIGTPQVCFLFVCFGFFLFRGWGGGLRIVE
jgi:RecA/RadA recombinase